jgi:hypothetical protein
MSHSAAKKNSTTTNSMYGRSQKKSSSRARMRFTGSATQTSAATKGAVAG